MMKTSIYWQFNFLDKNLSRPHSTQQSQHSRSADPWSRPWGCWRRWRGCRACAQSPHLRSSASPDGHACERGHLSHPGYQVQYYSCCFAVGWQTWAQMALLSLVSILTSLVPICFSANFLISCKDVASQYHGTIKFSSVNLDSPGSLILEADAMQPLVHVDGVLPGHHLHCMSSKNIRMGSVSM